MNMERRVLLAVFLSFIVLYIWQGVLMPPPPVEPEPPANTTTGAAAAPSPAGAPSAAPGSPEPPATATAAPAEPLIAEPAERDIRVETADVVAVFTNRGARLRSWRLKHYPDGTGQPQELIETAPGQPLPFTLRTGEPAVDATLNGALFTVGGAPEGSEPVAGPVDLRFEYRDASGLHAVKEFRLEPSSYVMSVRATVTAGERALPAGFTWGPAIGDRLEASALVQGAQGILLEPGASEPLRLTVDDIAEQPAYEGTFRYAGVDDNYFMTAALDLTGRIVYEPVTVPPAPNTDEPSRALISFTIDRADGATPLRFFVGPKAIDVLTAIDREFANAIHFGRFAVIVVPLLQSLKWVNTFVGNWGWSIVVLTLFINLVMAPLRHKQVVSMRKMQELQPQAKAIQDRYRHLKATDPAKQKMNQEMMALYREKKVNPAAGCVPMLLTLPIMIAMWAVLQVSIELRGAPWFGWIRDLSAADPIYVLPVLMVATQFWQMRITPMTGADPAQQKMMMFMPVIFGLFFFSLPAGALLYYVATTVFAIGQQYLTNYLIGPPPVHTVRPPAERRVKRKGDNTPDA